MLKAPAPIDINNRIKTKFPQQAIFGLYYWLHKGCFWLKSFKFMTNIYFTGIIFPFYLSKLLLLTFLTNFAFRFVSFNIIFFYKNKVWKILSLCNHFYALMVRFKLKGALLSFFTHRCFPRSRVRLCNCSNRTLRRKLEDSGTYRRRPCRKFPIQTPLLPDAYANDGLI